MEAAPRSCSRAGLLPEAEYAEEHLPGAINIPLKTLDADSTAQLEKTRAIVVYCWDGL